VIARAKRSHDFFPGAVCYGGDEIGVPVSLTKDPKRIRRDWYSVSVDTLRGLALILLIGALVGVGWLVWRRWEGQNQEREAVHLLAEGEGLLRQVREQPSSVAFRSELDSAVEGLKVARAAYEHQEIAAAVQNGRKSCDLLRGILDTSNLGKTGSRAQFVTIQGEVQFRRGETGEWQDADSRSVLRAGDYVRTSDGGSAEIRWSDGTLFTVRANTQFIVSPDTTAAAEQTIQMDYGWVDLSTRNRESQIRTPGAVAHVRKSSEAFVTFDRDSKNGRFGAVHGSLQVSAGGSTEEVGEMEQVVQKGGRLTPPAALPERPQPVAPKDDFAIDLNRQRSVVLAWNPVPEANRYALQVSRNRLFVGESLVDVDNRTTLRATLGLSGDGIFYWRVAAVSADGVTGPWCPTQRFLVTYGGRSGDVDRSSAQMDLDAAPTYGSIWQTVGPGEPAVGIEIGQLAEIHPPGIPGSPHRFNRF
jgi:hypothetical protein